MTEKYLTGIYLRLSKGDDDVDGVGKSESNSISNQRLIIDRFLEKHPEMEVVDTYIDDGYTGTNFKRPELKRMMFDVDEGRINCIVVKDLSRFGRERIQTGTYIQKVFKEKGVRFIAVNDNYDTLTADGSENHLIMPIKALTNDNFSKDISTKVRSSMSVKREKGEHIGATAPYGYSKDPEDHNHLVIDPYAADIVRTIFSKRMLGMSANRIANYLNELGILPPQAYKDSKTNGKKKYTAKWYSKQVLRILENEVYTGCVVQGRVEKVSYKVNKLVEKPKSEWDIVPGMHEPVISRSDFEIVQSLLERDVLCNSSNPDGFLFAGMVYCGDCGSPMVRKTTRTKEGNVYHYVCKNYNFGNNCASHKISEEMLMKIVKDRMNEMIRRLCMYEKLRENISGCEINRDEVIEHDIEIEKLKGELRKYSSLKAALYQDLEEGLLSKKQFEKYRKQYTDKEVELQSAIEKQKEVINSVYDEGICAESLLKTFKKNPHVEEIDRIMLVTMLDRILIYEDDSVELVYRYSERMHKFNQILKYLELQKEGK